MKLLKTIEDRLRFRSIKFRLIFLTGLCMFLAVVVMTASMVYSVRATSLKTARDESVSLARGNAARIKAELESAMYCSRTLAQVLSSVKDPDNSIRLGREDAAMMLRHVLEENESLLRIFSVWEPDAFDGRDGSFAGKNGYDGNGRFAVAWERDEDGEIVRVPITDFDDEERNQYYSLPRENLSECILEPFRKDQDHDAPLLTSLVAPVLADWEFQGVVGVDLNLQPFQEIADDLEVYDGTGRLTLISHEGTLAAVTSGGELRGRPMGAFYRTAGVEDKLSVIQDGAEIAISQEGMLEIYAPILVGASERPWAAGIVVPIDRITAESTALMWKQGLIGMILLLIVAAALWYIAGRIADPLEQITEGAKLLSLGDTEMEGLDSEKMQRINARGDELGEIGRAFNGLIEAQKAKAEYARKIAVGDLSIRIKAASEKDVLGNSMIEMIKSLKNMNSEVVHLTRAAVDGELDIRADVSRHSGEYADIVKGINDLLDSVVEPINRAAEILEAAAAKDLTGRVSGEYKGRFAHLMENINTTFESLDEALNRVTDTVEAVSRASSEISEGSRTLAEGASEQASALEEVSSSLEEMSSMTGQNADNANQAKALSVAARESAEKGKREMERMVEAIDQIRTSSSQTAKIVKTIDEIAFQTNLLALNAAVEAARAGDAGKGFAVVAEEVRSLAQRSAEAARNTAAMIEEAVKNAENGVNITHSVAGILNEIVDGSGRVNDLVAEIAAAAGEQAQGIEQINNGVAQMDSITQSNAANSEESAASSDELRNRAELLREMVAEFRLTDAERETADIRPELRGRSGKTVTGDSKKDDAPVNCWEHMKCGREPGGPKVRELGACPAATEKKWNRINGGKNSGRFCWSASGTLCGGKVQGSFAEKVKDCLKCDFLGRVKREQGADFVLKEQKPDKSGSKSGGNGKKRPAAEKLIPLEDKDFGDFKDF